MTSIGKTTKLYCNWKKKGLSLANQRSCRRTQGIQIMLEGKKNSQKNPKPVSQFNPKEHEQPFNLIFRSGSRNLNKHTQGKEFQVACLIRKKNNLCNLTFNGKFLNYNI